VLPGIFNNWSSLHKGVETSTCNVGFSSKFNNWPNLDKRGESSTAKIEIFNGTKI